MLLQFEGTGGDSQERVQQSRLDECLRDDRLIPSLIYGRDGEDLWNYLFGVFKEAQSACRLPIGPGWIKKDIIYLLQNASNALLAGFKGSNDCG